MSELQISILGIVLIFISTALGSALVYLFKDGISPKVNTLFLGSAAGVMVSASIFSLLIPAIEQSQSYGGWSFLPASVGFIVGGLFLVLLDKLRPHFHRGTNENEGPSVQVKKSVRLFLAVTLHNMPEGMAVGFALGAASTVGSTTAVLSALGLVDDVVKIVACPTCGRCEWDCMQFAKKVEDYTAKIRKPLKIAVMGCVVNGPGEAKDCDIGIAGSKDFCVIFKKGEIVKKVPFEDAEKEFVKELKNIE